MCWMMLRTASAIQVITVKPVIVLDLVSGVTPRMQAQTDHV